MEIYSLSRYFWDFAFEHPTKIKPVHVSIYFFAVEHCNRLGWKRNFGLPTSMVLEAIGVKSYSVYKVAFDQLVEYGFFDVIQYSKNQYSSNVIALKENYKANTNANVKALDKALSKHASKHVSKQCQSTVSINKQYTNIQETINNTNTIKSFDFKKEEVEVEDKRNIGEKQKLVFPYNSEKFMFLWNELVKMPKWRKKPFSAMQLTLHKLSEFDEEFVIELIENAITGNYQGIIFSNTKEKYEQFKQQKYGGENFRNNAKKQGVSKQELASILHEHFQNRDNSGG